jgi:hypothetical protein
MCQTSVRQTRVHKAVTKALRIEMLLSTSLTSTLRRELFPKRRYTLGSAPRSRDRTALLPFQNIPASSEVRSQPRQRRKQHRQLTNMTSKA